LSLKKTLLICSALLLGAGALVAAIFSTEPEAERSSASKRTAMLVEDTSVERGSFKPTIVATGTVRPEQEITLSPRVGGQVVSVAPSFTPGGFVAAGDILLTIDPADYEAALQQRRSELQSARADLEMELGRQEQARRDYEELKGSISDQYRTLVLREPQLTAAQAQVAAAQAAVRQAELELERTRIRAPFAAHILSREAHVGSQVAPGQGLGRLVGIDAYWVEATVPVSSVRWIDFPGPDGQGGAVVRVRNRAAWSEGSYRTGQIDSLIGALENQTRMARVLVTVPDPLAHSAAFAGQPPLMVGSFVEVRITGKPIDNVVRMDRTLLRQNDTVWLNQDGVLRIVPVEVVFTDQEFVYIGRGLDPAARVVTTNLATVVDGAGLRTANESP